MKTIEKIINDINDVAVSLEPKRCAKLKSCIDELKRYDEEIRTGNETLVKAMAYVLKNH